MVVSFRPGEREDQEHLDAVLTLRETLPHPDLSDVISEGADGLELVEREGEIELRIPGSIDSERAHQIGEVIWERLHFASHLREQRLGEFRSTELHRSDALALVQLLILYHLVTARAVVALGGRALGPRRGRSTCPRTFRSPQWSDQIDTASERSRHTPSSRSR